MWPAGESSIRTKYITLPSGISIRVVEAGLPNGAPLLLVPGWGSCVYSYSDTIPALADAGYRVLAIDLPGLGLSDKPGLASTYTTTAMTRAVSDAATSLGLDRFTFVGHSMGGAIGLRLVLEGEPRIEKLVLLSSVGLGRAPLMGPVRLLLPRLVDPLLPAIARRLTFRFILALAFGTPGRPTQRDVDQYWAPSQFPEMLRACRLLAHNFDFDPLPDEALRKIDIPVLAIAAGRDRLVLGCSERARLIPGARVLTLDDGGHLAFQERASTVNPAILGFLSQKPI
jgi:pimeloyl-ACP methyl ester carboxylesterase